MTTAYCLLPGVLLTGAQRRDMIDEDNRFRQLLLLVLVDTSRGNKSRYSRCHPHRPQKCVNIAHKILPQSALYRYQDKKAPASIATFSQSIINVNIFSTSSSPPTAVDSHHSRSTSQSNTFAKVPSLILPSTPSQNRVVVACGNHLTIPLFQVNNSSFASHLFFC